MKVQVQELSPIERQLNIEVEPERVTEELNRAYSTLGQQVKIAGFRPGKIPRRILEQRYRPQIESDVIERVVQRAYYTAIAENKVEAVSNPKVTPEPLKIGQPFSFQARVEVKPKPEVKEYQGLELKREDQSVTDEAVNERIEQMRGRMAHLAPLEGRDAAQEKDYAIVDYQGTLKENGQAFEGGTAEGVTVEVAPGELVQGNIPQLVGAKVGEEKEVDYTFPADYPDEKLRGKETHFKIQVKGLKQQSLPELNDEFAKEIGGGQTLQELKDKVRKDLTQSKKSSAEQAERDQLVKQLVEKNAFEVPRAMVDRAVEYMLEGALRNITRGGIDPRQLGLDFGKLRDEFRPRAENEVKGSLLLEQIALKEKIEATDAEVDERVETVAKDSGSQAVQVRQHFRDPEERRGLSLRLREEKTIEFLKAHAKTA